MHLNLNIIMKNNFIFMFVICSQKHKILVLVLPKLLNSLNLNLGVCEFLNRKNNWLTHKSHVTYCFIVLNLL